MKDKTDFYCTESQGFLQAWQRAELLLKTQAGDRYKKEKRQLICFAEKISFQHNMRRKVAQCLKVIHGALGPG